MASYKIVIKRSAEKEILSVPKPDRARVLDRIRKLGPEPRPTDCEKLKGKTVYRIRQGSWRIVYAISDADRIVTIVRIGHRKEVYR